MKKIMMMAKRAFLDNAEDIFIILTLFRGLYFAH